MTPLPDPRLNWPICMAAVALCAEKESLRLKAYRCSAGKWTCGWGETDGVGPTTEWTRNYADQRFCDSLTHYAAEVRGMLTAEDTTANELGAMTVLAYNIGLRDDSTKRGFYWSTVRRAHNKGDRAAAARAFGLFNKFRNPATGQLEVSKGLTIRRAQESALYLTADHNDDSPPIAMPQVVAPESSMAQSPINAGGAATVAGGALTVWSQYGDQAKGALATMKTIAADLGIQLPVLLGCALVLAGAAVIYQRVTQRNGGWA